MTTHSLAGGVAVARTSAHISAYIIARNRRRKREKDEEYEQEQDLELETQPRLMLRVRLIRI